MNILIKIWNNKKFWKIYCKCIEISVVIGWLFYALIFIKGEGRIYEILK